MSLRFRVLWRYARGIISSDDSLFNRYEAPHLDRVILDPVREKDAGNGSDTQGVRSQISRNWAPTFCLGLLKTFLLNEMFIENNENNITVYGEKKASM